LAGGVFVAASEAIADPDLHSLFPRRLTGRSGVRAPVRRCVFDGRIDGDADPRRHARVASATIHMLSIRARARIPRAEILPIIDDAVITICGTESDQTQPARVS